jgi:hypothetical protein
MIGLAITQILEEDLEDSKDKDIRKVYGMDVSEVRARVGDTGGKFEIIKSAEAIPRVSGRHVPENVRKRLEDDHETYHLGQELHDDRCPLCVEGPKFKKSVLTRLEFKEESKEESDDDRVVAVKGAWRKASRKGKSFGVAISKRGEYCIHLGSYTKIEYRDYAYDCAVRALDLDFSRLRFPKERPAVITERIAKIIEENVEKCLKKASSSGLA